MADLAAQDRILEALQCRFFPKTVDTIKPAAGMYYRVWGAARVLILRVSAERLALLDAQPPEDMAQCMESMRVFSLLESLPPSSHVVWSADDEPRVHYD